LMEQMNYNLLFRWFVGLELDEPVWNHAVFSKNRDRLLNQDVAREFFSRVLAQVPGRVEDWCRYSVGPVYPLLPVSVGSASLSGP